MNSTVRPTLLRVVSFLMRGIFGCGGLYEYYCEAYPAQGCLVFYQRYFGCFVFAEGSFGSPFICNDNPASLIDQGELSIEDLQISVELNSQWWKGRDTRKG